MLTELVLIHPCGQAFVWSAGAYFGPRGRRRCSGAAPVPITHCPTCGEWLGSPFLRAEASSGPSHSRTSRVRARAS